jgi:hypothetical protein
MRKRRVAMVLTAGVLIGVIGVTFWPKNMLEILGSTLASVTLETVDDIQRQPRVNVTLPIIGRVIYPSPYKGQFTAGAKAMAFNLDPKTTAGVIYPKGKRFIVMSGMVDLESAAWTLQGQTVEVAHMMGGANYVECPLLYGSTAEEAEVSTTMFDTRARGIDRFRVRLPACGTPEPKYPSYSAKAGSFTVKFDPLPRLSPMFPLRYRVRVEGAPRSVFLIRFTNAADHVPVARYEHMLRCTPEEPGIFRPEGDIFEAWRNRGKTRRLDLAVKRLAPKDLTLKARVTSPSDVKLVDKTGRAFAWTESGNGLWVSTLRGEDGVAALRFGPFWSPWDSSEELGRPWSSMIYMDKSRAYLRSLKEGEEVETTVYSVAEVHTAQVTIDNPN